MATIDRRAIYERDRGLCGFCGEPVPIDDFDIDHMPARALQPLTIYLRTSHPRCNAQAGQLVRRELRQRAGVIEQKGYALRLPKGVIPKLKRWARLERRSLNGQITILLEAAIALAEQEGILPIEESESEPKP